MSAHFKGLQKDEQKPVVETPRLDRKWKCHLVVNKLRHCEQLDDISQTKLTRICITTCTVGYKHMNMCTLREMMSWTPA